MEWDDSHLSSSVEIATVKKTHSFSSIRFRWQSHGVRGPHLTRRVAQAKWGLSAIGCLSSATSHEVCGLSGRVSMDAHFDEQRRNQAEAGVHFLLVTCSLGKQRKVTR